MTETGIYGGSFNPIHRGHVELAERLCRDEGLDELWFMVSPQNPFKKSSPDLLNEKIRLELARMAVREHPCLKVSAACPARPTRQTLWLPCGKLIPTGFSH